MNFSEKNLSFFLNIFEFFTFDFFNIITAP